MDFPSKGFTLIKVLITAFVLGVVTVAISGLSLVITRSSIESERATVAQGLLNEKLKPRIRKPGSKELTFDFRYLSKYNGYA